MLVEVIACLAVTAFDADLGVRVSSATVLFVVISDRLSMVALTSSSIDFVSESVSVYQQQA